MEKLNLASEELLERPDLVAIDGVLYDLIGLAKVHPGGDLIQAAGAADGTALFYSMHPGIKPENSQLLQRFVRGTHQRTSKEPRYTFDSPFAQDLKRSVRETMKGKNWYATPGFWARTALIILLTALGEWYWATTGFILWGIFTGFMHAQVGLAIQHDASHGAMSNTPWVNALFAYGIDIIGSSRWIWLQAHIMRHHTYTNQCGLDLDCTSGEPIILFHQYPGSSTTRKWFHRFQAWYLHTVVIMYGVSMVYNPFYILHMQHNETIPKTTTAIHENGFLRKYRPFAALLRFFFIFRIVFLPWYLTGTSLLITVPLIPTAAGIFLTFVFVLSHNFEGSERTPEKACRAKPTDGDGKEVEDGDIDWYRAQVETSCTFGGVFSMVLSGGANFQIEHHLFPGMSSWHYPSIQKSVRECCGRHGVRYTYFPTILENLISTLRYMNKVGIAQTLKDAQEF